MSSYGNSACLGMIVDEARRLVGSVFFGALNGGADEHFRQSIIVLPCINARRAAILALSHAMSEEALVEVDNGVSTSHAGRASVQSDPGESGSEQICICKERERKDESDVAD